MIDRIQDNAGAQQSGSGTARGGVTSKAVLRDALYLELKWINRSAAALAAEQGKPDLMDKFRLPHGATDTILVAKARAIADAAQPMANDFIGLAHADSFVNDLRAHIAAFQSADETKDAGEQSRAGATAEFGPLLEEAMKKVKQLDAIMHNFYRTNAERMGEWLTASHVERQANKKEDPAKPTP